MEGGERQRLRFKALGKDANGNGKLARVYVVNVGALLGADE